MNTRLYLFIFIPLLIICAGGWWLLTQREQHRQAARLLSDRALLEVGDISVIEIMRPDETVRLEKQGETSEGAGTAENWRMTQPFDAGCDPVALAALIDGIMAMESERDISPVDTAQQEEYRIADPDLQIRLTSSSGDVLMDLAIGLANPVGTSRYAAFANDLSTAFLVPIFQIEPIDVAAADLRDARALSFNPETTVGVHLTSPAADIVLADQEGIWYVTSPNTFPASPARVDQLFHDLSELTAVEFLPENASDPHLSTTSVEVVLSDASGTTQQLTLHGEDIARGIFATSSWQPTSFIVEAYIFDRLALNPDVFYHVLLIDFSPSQIDRVLVRQPGSDNLEIERTGDGAEDFRILRPEGRSFTNPGDFAAFIDSVLSLQPEHGIPAPERREDYGLEPVYFLKVEVYGEGSDEPVSIKIGATDESGNYYATQDGISFFTVNSGLVQRFLDATARLKGGER